MFTFDLMFVITIILRSIIKPSGCNRKRPRWRHHVPWNYNYRSVTTESVLTCALTLLFFSTGAWLLSDLNPVSWQRANAITLFSPGKPRRTGCFRCTSGFRASVFPRRSAVKIEWANREERATPEDCAPGNRSARLKTAWQEDPQIKLLSYEKLLL